MGKLPGSIPALRARSFLTLSPNFPDVNVCGCDKATAATPALIVALVINLFSGLHPQCQGLAMSALRRDKERRERPRGPAPLSLEFSLSPPCSRRHLSPTWVTIIATSLSAASGQRSHPAGNSCGLIRSSVTRDSAEGGTRLLSAPASPNRPGSATLGRKPSQSGCPGEFPHKNKR